MDKAYANRRFPTISSRTGEQHGVWWESAGVSGDVIVHVCMLVCAYFTTCAGVRTEVWPIALYVSQHYGSANLERFVGAHKSRKD